MAINLASKYSDQIAEVFTRASFIKGKTAETYDLTGVKTLKVYTPITVEESCRSYPISWSCLYHLTYR